MKYSLLLLPLVLIGSSCTTTEQTTTSDLLPIIDTHAHIYPVSEELNAEYVDTLVAVAQANGVSKILLGLNARPEPDRPPTFSSTHDDWVLAAAARYPEVIIPALNGFDPANPAAIPYVLGQLATGQWQMIGELDLRNRPKKTTIAADNSIVMQIYALAGAHHIPVMIHYDFDYGTDRTTGLIELEHALSANSATNFIYAHNCGPDIATLMATHSNLYCEQEGGSIAPNVDLSRVLLGTDMQVHENNPDLAAEQYASLIGTVRGAIAAWSSEDQTRAATTTPTMLFEL